MNKTLLDEAMGMSPKERVVFAELILQSIDYEEKEIREIWLMEVKDRMTAVNEGNAKLIDFEARYSED